MARSLNELIAYLRGEIALCGQLGKCIFRVDVSSRGYEFEPQSE